VRRARALLTEALEIVDKLKLSPEIGARVQEAISALEECSGAKASSETAEDTVSDAK